MLPPETQHQHEGGCGGRYTIDIRLGPGDIDTSNFETALLNSLPSSLERCIAICREYIRCYIDFEFYLSMVLRKVGSNEGVRSYERIMEIGMALQACRYHDINPDVQQITFSNEWIVNFLKRHDLVWYAIYSICVPYVGTRTVGFEILQTPYARHNINNATFIIES
jgi:hypothetical protein